MMEISWLGALRRPLQSQCVCCSGSRPRSAWRRGVHRNSLTPWKLPLMLAVPHVTLLCGLQPSSRVSACSLLHAALVAAGDYVPVCALDARVGLLICCSHGLASLPATHMFDPSGSSSLRSQGRSAFTLADCGCGLGCSRRRCGCTVLWPHRCARAAAHHPLPPFPSLSGPQTIPPPRRQHER